MPPFPSPCTCPLAGWCETHRREMSGDLHALCRSDGRYFHAFANDLRRADAAFAPRGVGDTLKWLFRLTGVERIVKRRAAARRASCGCAARQSLLNRWLPYPERLRRFLALWRIWRRTKPAE